MDKKHTRLELDEVSKILELARHRLSVAEIARIVERSDTAINNALRDFGVAVKPGNRTDAEVTAAFDLIDRGIRPRPHSNLLRQRRTSSGKPKRTKLEWLLRRQPVPEKDWQELETELRENQAGARRSIEDLRRQVAEVTATIDSIIEDIEGRKKQ